jgi:hypothetical protein
MNWMNHIQSKPVETIEIASSLRCSIPSEIMVTIPGRGKGEGLYPLS